VTVGRATWPADRRPPAAGPGTRVARVGPTAPSHLVWDWNGTLLDDLAAVVGATNRALASAGAGPVTTDEHRRDFRRPVGDYYADVLGRPLAAAEFAALDHAFHDAYQAALAGVPLAGDAVAALRAWTGSQSLLSMWFHDELVMLLGKHGLAGHFVRVDGLRQRPGGGGKTPHLAAHLAALGRQGRECVLIGDSLDDAVAAAAVGAGCVLYAGGVTTAERLAATGFPVAHTLSDAVALAARER
jgi:phosphoglycolate phosphatase-like HAD superfamily hydrolase